MLSLKRVCLSVRRTVSSCSFSSKTAQKYYVLTQTLLNCHQLCSWYFRNKSHVSNPIIAKKDLDNRHCSFKKSDTLSDVTGCYFAHAPEMISVWHVTKSITFIMSVTYPFKNHQICFSFFYEFIASCPSDFSSQLTISEEHIYFEEQIIVCSWPICILICIWWKEQNYTF